MDRESILVIKLGALGDFIQALGPMASIRKHHKSASITLLTTKPFFSLAEASGYFDHIWLDERPKLFNVSQWLLFRKKLYGAKFDRIYDLQNNDRTQLYFNLLSRPKPVWVGAAKGAAIRNASPLRTAGSGFDGHKQTLALAGIENVKIDPLEWVQGKNNYTGLKAPYVLIAAGSAPSRLDKRWPAENYAELGTRLSNLGFQPVLIGAEAEIELNNKILSLCPAALNLCGETSLFDIVALARNASAAIGNDTGPMHMIAPTGIPALVLFSRYSNPTRHAPNGKNVGTLQRDNLADLTVDEVWKYFMDYASLAS